MISENVCEQHEAFHLAKANQQLKSLILALPYKVVKGLGELDLIMLDVPTSVRLMIQRNTLFNKAQ